MKLFEMYLTHENEDVVGRNITINGNEYLIDIFTPKYINENPTTKNSLAIWIGFQFYEFEKWNPDPVIF